MDNRHAMNPVPIRLGWSSPESAEAVLDALRTLGYSAEVSREAMDAAVVDIRAFHNLKAAMAYYHELQVPALVVVKDHSQETGVLPQLRLRDELCRTDAFAAQAALRLSRMTPSRRTGQDSASTAAGAGDTVDGAKGDGGGRRGSNLDELTGLQNRHGFALHFFDDVRHAGADRPLSLVYVDLDNFKRINETYGHNAGDQVLTTVGEILRQACRGVAGLSRYGGEEFVVSLWADADQAARLAEFVRTEIAAHHFSFADEEVSVTASFGVATSTGDLSGQGLMAEADRCLYAAKARGRNVVVAADRHTGDEAHDTDRVVEDFENRVRVMTERLIKVVTARGKAMAQSLRDEADLDGLTGVYVRRYFDRRLGREFERARGDARELSLLFLDVDHFGEVNRTYGFPTGDSALRYIAGVLKDSIRVVDWVARYGGEEFCVVLPDTSAEEAVAIAERIRKRIESGSVETYDGRVLSLTASLGVGTILASDQTIVDLVRRISDKTREAKRLGRNRVVW